MMSKSILEAKFLRSKLVATNTQLWKQFSGINKQFVMSKITTESGEDGILIFYMNAGYWWLLTINNFIIYSNGVIRTLSLSEIESVMPDQLTEDSNAKSEMNQLLLRVRNEVIPITIENKTWHVIYDVLRFAIRR